jgi:hypothetical protein
MKVNVGQTKDAIGFLEKDNEIAERLTRLDPKDVQALKDLYLSDFTLGALTNSANDYPAAVDWLTKARAIADSLQKNDSLTGEEKLWPTQVAFQLGVCQNGLRAIADIDFIFTQKPVRIPNLLDGRVQALLKRKQVADAAASVERFVAWVEKQEDDRDENRYRAARLFALCAEATDMPYVLLDQAIALLNKAKDADYFTPPRVAQIRKDSDFNGIRQNAKFVQFMSQLEAKK